MGGNYHRRHLKVTQEVITEVEQRGILKEYNIFKKMYDFESFQSCDTDDQKLENESVNQAIVENPVTFHCGRCNTVWADSRGICGEATSVNSLICLGKLLHWI